jgi:MerR family Zn(II)-responsive transcriptional regulator of zntA
VPTTRPRTRLIPLLTTGDMARLSETTLRTVRFYEEAGILRPTKRTDGGHRLFAREELERLRLVIDMREAGLSLDDVRSLLELKHRASSGGEAAQGATAALQSFVVSLRAKITSLTRLCEDLDASVARAEACAGCAEEELFPHRCHECDRLVAHGPVPRGLRVLWGMPAEATPGDGTDGATPVASG